MEFMFISIGLSGFIVPIIEILSLGLTTVTVIFTEDLLDDLGKVVVRKDLKVNEITDMTTDLVDKSTWESISLNTLKERQKLEKNK